MTNHQHRHASSPAVSAASPFSADSGTAWAAASKPIFEWVPSQKRLLGRCSAAAQRNGRLASGVDDRAVGVNELDWSFYAKRTFGTNSDGYFYISHSSAPEKGGESFEIKQPSRCRGSAWLWVRLAQAWAGDSADYRAYQWWSWVRDPQHWSSYQPSVPFQPVVLSFCAVLPVSQPSIRPHDRREQQEGGTEHGFLFSPRRKSIQINYLGQLSPTERGH